MIAPAFAERFAREWIEAWNSHDLDRILEHYAGGFEMSSPLIVHRMGEPSGTLRGKDAVRDYWAKGLASAPALHFTLEHVFTGVDSVVVGYRRESGVRAAETFFFDAAGKVIRGVAHYG